MSIHAKLLDIQKTMPRIDKDSKNPHFKSNYAGLANVLSIVLPLINQHGLYQSNEQTFLEHAGWVLIVKLIDAESGTLVSTMLPLLNTNDMQKMGGCITYAQRYGLLPLLGIAPEMDDDGNNASTPKFVGTERAKLIEEINELLDGIRHDILTDTSEKEKFYNKMLLAKKNNFADVTIEQLRKTKLWILGAINKAHDDGQDVESLYISMADVRKKFDEILPP